MSRPQLKRTAAGGLIVVPQTHHVETFVEIPKQTHRLKINPQYRHNVMRYNGAWYRSVQTLPQDLYGHYADHFEISIADNAITMHPKQHSIYGVLKWNKLGDNEDPIRDMTGFKNCTPMADCTVANTPHGYTIKCNEILYEGSIISPAGKTTADYIRSAFDYAQVKGGSLLLRNFNSHIVGQIVHRVGNQMLKDFDGEVHLPGGKTIQVKDDCVHYFTHGLYDRESRPAIENIDGSDYWYTHGVLNKTVTIVNTRPTKRPRIDDGVKK